MSKSRKRSIFLNLLVSYFLVSLIPLIVLTCTLYYFIVINNQNELREKNTGRLTYVKNSTDSDLRHLDDFSYHFSALISEGTINPDSSTESIVSQIKYYRDNWEFAEEVLYYVRGDRNIYTGQAMYYYATYENELQYDLKMKEAAFVTRLNTVLAPSVGVIEYVDGTDNNTSNVVALYYPVPHLSASPTGVMVYFVSQSLFLGKFAESFGDFDGYTYLFDEYYEIVASSEKGMTRKNIEGMEEELKKTKGSGIIEHQVDGADFTIIKIVSEQNGWTYVVAMPPSQYMADIKLMWNIVVTIVVVTFFIGIVMTYLMSIKRYSPLKLIVSGLTSKDPKIGTKGNNEYDVIQTALDTAYERNALLSDQMDNQRPLIKDQCLLRIIGDSDYDEEGLDYLMKSSNLELEAREYFVAVLSIKGEASFVTKQIELVSGLVEELSFPGGRGYGVELVRDPRIAVVFCLFHAENGSELQREVSEMINDIIMKAYQFKVDIGIGRIYENISLLNNSFHEASAALDNRLADEDSRLYFYSRIDEHNQIHWHSIKEQSLFLQSLKSGDQKSAMASFDDMLHSIANHDNSPFVMKCICFDVINNIIRYINQKNLEGFSAQVIEILEFKSLSDFASAMKKFIDAFCDAIGDLEESRRNELKQNVIRHLNTHYNSSDLSLESVAGAFNLTTTYLSRFFKDETGVNYLEYVTQLRMNEAKEQLTNTSKSIKAIMSSVGYMDTASFVRKFKSIEGITPGQYRQINKL